MITRTVVGVIGIGVCAALWMTGCEKYTEWVAPPDISGRWITKVRTHARTGSKRYHEYVITQSGENAAATKSEVVTEQHGDYEPGYTSCSYDTGECTMGLDYRGRYNLATGLLTLEDQPITVEYDGKVYGKWKISGYCRFLDEDVMVELEEDELDRGPTEDFSAGDVYYKQ